MADRESTATSYYVPLSAPAGADPEFEYFQPTEATISVWSADLQHGGPPAGLMMRSMTRAVDDDGQQFSRVTTEILGAMGLGVNRVKAWVSRPGRRISQVTAELEVQMPDGEYRLAGRTVAWRILAADSADAEHRPLGPLPAAPDDLPQVVGFPDDGDTPVPWGRIGFIGTAITARQEGRNGQTPATWIKSMLPLVEGEVSSNLVAVFTVLDVANGVGTRLDPTRWSWMNMDTTVHLVGQPTSPWLGIDSDLAIGRDGYGASFADLYDVSGFLGRSAQTDMIVDVRR